VKFIKTAIPSVYIIETGCSKDERGRFSRVYCRNENAENHLEMEVVQINRSINTLAGTFRGLHYQRPPACECKRIICVRGRIYDIIVDLRKDSPAFLHWIGIELSADQQRIIHIPEGCAHGFQTLEPDTELIYLHSANYSADHEEGVRFSDPQLNIELPMPVSKISQRDAAMPLLTSAFGGLQT
jgi:dTDP-4-dehydrorhamnose 3,5-epimerase